MREKILIVEDEEEIAMLEQDYLEINGFQTRIESDGEQAVELALTGEFDLILLDLMLPGKNGYDICREIRDKVDVPILMVTAKDLPEEKCKGFIVGTDDYMVKPVNEEELVLRIKALLRRSQIASEHRLKIGKVSLDYDSFTVSRDGVSQTIPQKEFQLLYKLLSYPDKIFTRLQLMDEIWGMESNTVDTTVNVHITRLRRRFEEWPEFEIIAIRGIGYKAVIHNE